MGDETCKRMMSFTHHPLKNMTNTNEQKKTNLGNTFTYKNKQSNMNYPHNFSNNTT